MTYPVIVQLRVNEPVDPEGNLHAPKEAKKTAVVASELGECLAMTRMSITSSPPVASYPDFSKQNSESTLLHPCQKDF